MRLFTFLFACLLSSPIAAEGFAIEDFQDVKLDLSRFAGGEYDARAEQDRIIIACESCKDRTFLYLEKGRSTDGTEGRFRSGETTVEDMRAICRARDPDCKLEGLYLGQAVGWITEYELGDAKGSTAILFRDGDLLTIRATSSKRRLTKANMAAALKFLAPQIVGQ